MKDGSTIVQTSATVASLGRFRFEWEVSVANGLVPLTQRTHGRAFTEAGARRRAERAARAIRRANGNVLGWRIA